MLNNKFKEVIENLENNIKNKNDLNYAKSQIAEISMLYLEELEQLEVSFQERLAICERKIEILEHNMEKVEEEVYQEEGDTDLEPISCPYCNANFFIEFDNSKKEIQCPSCKNMIELDWGNFEDDM